MEYTDEEFETSLQSMLSYAEDELQKIQKMIILRDSVVL